ncbi:MAG: D-alanine--D-alanine ligase [Candidatus Kerfeldbacteria bacterium]|nr:D-alanine--D-alanine ligase [Candidatus Kerfeldbacteria bacterium]
MAKRIRIGIIFGGRSSEHEVSLVSATSVMQHLNPKKFEVVPIGITKSGAWVTEANPLRRLKGNTQLSTPSESIITPDANARGLVTVRTKKKIEHQLSTLDVVFPVLHGPYGEDGTIQGLLELANIPYVGSGVLGSAVAMDKVVQKQVCQQLDIPVVPYTSVKLDDLSKRRATVLRAVQQLGYPVFVKPANLGSSVGISKVKTQRDLIAAIRYAGRYDRKIIIEKAVVQPREIEVAVLGNDQPQASLPGEIISSNEFYDYDAKYVDGKSFDQIPARLPKNIITAIQRWAVQAFTACNCAGLARVDFLVSKKDGRVFLNEINTIPGFTSISMYPKLWQASGLSYSKLLEKLIALALERFKQKKNLLTSYQPKSNWYH